MLPITQASGGGGGAPKKAHRIPSTTAAIGLSQTNGSMLGGTTLRDQIIGVEKNHTWMMKGSICSTSRYRAFSAASQNVTPRAVERASKTINGTKMTLMVGRSLKNNIISSSATTPNRKSTIAEIAIPIGRSARGK